MPATKLIAGEQAPEFALKDQDGKVRKLSDYKGQWAILYFYPKDMTPGCTLEAQEFRDHEYEIGDLEAVVLGISADDAKSHKAFCEAESLNFTLLADVGGDVCREYGVWKEKAMFGNKFMGIERTTFLVAPDGSIRHIFRKVKPLGHAEEAITKLRELQGVSDRQ